MFNANLKILVFLTLSVILMLMRLKMLMLVMLLLMMLQMQMQVTSVCTGFPAKQKRFLQEPAEAFDGSNLHFNLRLSAKTKNIRRILMLVSAFDLSFCLHVCDHFLVAGFCCLC